MPVNKNAILRFRVIDKCLRDQFHEWTKKQITEAVNNELINKGFDPITDHTIRFDLEFIDQHLVKIDKYPEKKILYYKYYNTDDSIFNMPLDKKDMRKIEKVISLLSNIKGFEVEEEVLAILDYLHNRMHVTKGNRNIIRFDHQPVSDGTELIPDFLGSIQEETVLSLDYQPFTAEKPEKLVFHPYVLKEYNNRWFCIGYCSSRKTIMNLGLDRVVGKLKPLRDAYIQNEFFDPEAYFNDIIGVTRTENREKTLIKLRFSKARSPYVLKKPLHHSQVELSKDKQSRSSIQLELIPNKELVSLILSFGPDVEVLEPKELVEEVKDALKQNMAQY